MSTNTPPKYSEWPIVVFLDSIGRVIIGAQDPEAKSNNETLDVYGPAILNVIPSGPNPGEMGIQVIPIVFPDLTSDVNVRSKFSFPRTAITLTDSELAGDIADQYRKSLQPRSPLILPTDAGELTSATPPVQKLF